MDKLNKQYQFELLSFYLWKIGHDLEWRLQFIKIGNRALFGVDYETACATVVSILFVRVEIFDKKEGFKRFFIS